jgi:hypothetical protein
VWQRDVLYSVRGLVVESPRRGGRVRGVLGDIDRAEINHSIQNAFFGILRFLGERTTVRLVDQTVAAACVDEFA